MASLFESSLDQKRKKKIKMFRVKKETEDKPYLKIKLSSEEKYFQNHFIV